MLVITIAAEGGTAGAGDPIRQLGPIVLRSPIFRLERLDGGLSETEVTVAGRRYVIADLELTEPDHDAAHPAIRLEVIPADDDPFAEDRRSDGPEW